MLLEVDIWFVTAAKNAGSRTKQCTSVSRKVKSKQQKASHSVKLSFNLAVIVKCIDFNLLLKTLVEELAGKISRIFKFQNFCIYVQVI